MSDLFQTFNRNKSQEQTETKTDRKPTETRKQARKNNKVEIYLSDYAIDILNDNAKTLGISKHQYIENLLREKGVI